MKLVHLLSLGAVASYILLFIISKQPRRLYILFVLFCFPVIDLAVVPEQWGRLRVFDIITYLTLFRLSGTFLPSKYRISPYAVLSLLFLSAAFIGSLTSLYVANSLKALMSVFPAFIFAKLLIDECVEHAGFGRRVVFLIRSVAVLSIIFLVPQLIFGLEFTFYPELNPNTAKGDNIRYPGFFQDPQMFAQYLSLICFLFFINNDSGEKRETLVLGETSTTVGFRNSSFFKSPDWKNYLLFLAGIFALLQTGGRSAALAVIAGAAFLFFVFDKKYKIMLSALIIAGTISYAFLSDSLVIFNRADSAKEDFLFRAALWEEASVIFKNHPVIGIGSGNFKPYNRAYTNLYLIDEKRDVIFFGYGQPESGYWMLLTELGALGFLVFFSFIIGPVITGIRNFRKGNTDLLIFILIAGILSWLVTFISAYSLYDRRILVVLVSFICLLMVESRRRLGRYVFNIKEDNHAI